MSLFRTDLWYTPELLQANLNFIFVFGDNLQRQGKGGQAKIRDEPNAVGLATKLAPDDEESSFFDDRCDAKLIEEINHILHYSLFHDVVIPFSDRVELGTGLSQLPERAPRLYLLLSRIFTSNLPVANLITR